MPPQPPLVLPPLGDFDRASWLAGLTNRVGGSGGVADLNAWFDERFTGRSFGATAGGTNVCPSWYFAMTRQLAVLVMRGLENLAQATQMVFGYTGPRDVVFWNPSNPWLQAAADSVTQQLSDWGISLPPHVAMAGHSAGGAILSLLPSRPSWAGTYGYVTPDIDTFGAPRHGNPQECGTADSKSKLERWMNHEDPVPLLPPRTDTWLNGINGLGAGQARRCSYFCHRGSGYQLNSDGTGSPRDLPDVGVPEAVSNLVSWLMAQEGSNTFHSIPTYYNRLLQRADQRHTSQAPAVPQRVEPVLDQRPSQINSIARSQASAISAIERRQNANPVVIPVQFLFRAVRLSRNWFVYYQDQQVAWCGSRRQAHALARHGNEMLRVLQRVAVVNTDTVVSAFQTYVAAAVDPANNFVPVMNTEVPVINP